MNDLDEVAAEVLGDLSRIRLAAFDFDGVFTDNAVYVSQDGTEMVRCWRGDGIGLEAIRRLGIEALVISTETNPVVALRCDKMGVACRQASRDKSSTLREVWERGTGSPETTLFLGNDVNDLPVLREVGFPAVVADAHPDVVPLARYRTRTRGGHGAVREVCDLLVRARSGAPPA